MPVVGRRENSFWGEHVGILLITMAIKKKPVYRVIRTRM